jgi:hypothetical protein
MMLPASSPGSTRGRGGRSTPVRACSVAVSGGAAGAAAAGLLGRRATSASTPGVSGAADAVAAGRPGRRATSVSATWGRPPGSARRLLVDPSAVEERAGAGTVRGVGAGAWRSSMRGDSPSGRDGSTAGVALWTGLTGGIVSGSRDFRAPLASGCAVACTAGGEAASPAAALPSSLLWRTQSEAAATTTTAARTIAGATRRPNARRVVGAVGS